MTTLFIAHNNHQYFIESLQAFERKVPSFIFVNKLPFFGEAGNWQHTAKVAEAAGATVVVGEWHGEIEHRTAAREHLLALGYTHQLTDRFRGLLAMPR